MKKRKSNTLPVRVAASTHEDIRELVARAQRYGWEALGYGREETPTTAGVIDAAIVQLKCVSDGLMSTIAAAKKT